MNSLASTLRWFTDLIWPARCVVCGALGTELCATCLATLRPLNEKSRTHGSYIDSLIVSAHMHGTIETIIHAFKYRGIRALAEPLAGWSAGVIGLRRDTAAMFGANPLFVPVPLHASRLRERGFNQAELLAQRLASIAAMPVDASVLVRTRRTGSQVETHSRWERIDNMRGAFVCAKPDAVRDRDIILVDDVCTTGATLDDCARALKESGARCVSAVVLARG